MSEEQAVYSYLPWVRRGIASALGRAGGDLSGVAANPRLPVTLRVDRHLNDQVVNEQAHIDLRLYGPGDILGIDSRQIARVEPRAFSRDLEPNYLAAVEFTAPDFPWLFTPMGAARGQSLPPWLALVVVEAGDGVTIRSHPRRPLPTLEISDPADPARELPDLKESAHWCHVQAVHDPASEGELDEDRLAQKLRDHPERVVSRIVSPRRLTAHTDYWACLVPTFQAGVDRGLGLVQPAENALRWAWDLASPPTAISLPVYYHWEFSTGAAGDFESLARLLKPRPAPGGVGTRPMDIADPGYGIASSVDARLPLESALQAPETVPPAWTEENRRRQLKELLNLGAGDPDSPPLVVPPQYGQFPAGRETVPDLGVSPRWFGDLNLDPRHRAAAGIGAEVARRNQESLMESAWSQIGEVTRANQLLRQAQLARAVGERFLLKHLERMNVASQIQLTAPAHGRLLVNSATFRHRIRGSSLSSEILSGAFRRRFGSRRSLAKRSNGALSPVSLIQAQAGSEIEASVPGPAGAVTMRLVRSLAPGASAPPLLAERFGFWLSFSGAVGLLSLAILVGVLVWTRSYLTALEIALATLALVAGGTWFWLRRLRSLSRVRERLQPESWAPAGVLESTPRPSFEVVASNTPIAPRRSGKGADSPAGKRFREAAARQLEALGPDVATAVKKRPRLDLAETAGLLRSRLDPSKTIPGRVRARIKLQDRDWSPKDPIEPIRAAPDFLDAMYRPLAQVSPHYLLAGLDRIPPNTLTLLETNSAFVEAYLIGLNHEMGRELLWREYPTERRASFFRQFWDPAPALPPLATGAEREAAKDIPPIHTWSNLSRLGEHTRTRDGNLALLIKGELIRRYPNTVISFVRAEWTDDHVTEARAQGVQVIGGKYRRPARARTEADLRWPVFTGNLPTDITFLGFDLSVAEARGEIDDHGDPVPDGDPGWFLVLREPPGETRFGLDEGDGGSPPDSVADLTWAHVLAPGSTHVRVDAPPLRGHQFTNPAVTWGANSAHMACILLQPPVVVAIHADDMLGGVRP